MSRYVVAYHGAMGEDIEMKQVYASSELMAAKATVDTENWPKQPKTFGELQHELWQLFEAYISVLEIQ